MAPHITVSTNAPDSGMSAAMQQAFDSRRPIRAGVNADTQGTTTIYFPAGVYRFSEIKGFMGRESTGQKVTGLRFKGDGKSLTQVIFDPEKDGPFLFNDYWMNIAFEGMSFNTLRPGATFMQSYTTHNAQEYIFTDVGWGGPWKYVFDLQGDNNNSEYSFYACSTGGLQDDGAFLHIGAENTSDQFLNYWFYGFKHWSTSAALIDAAKGGHFHLYGVDVSNWGVNLTKPGYLINLRGRSHAQGVTTMTAKGLRVEAKNPRAGLIHSEWPSGNVDIQCDWSSQTPYYTYGDIISIDLGNTPGPVYNFHDSNLAGGVRVAYGVNAWENQHRIGFTNCGWAQRLTPSEVVSYVDPSANRIRPAATFDGCRGEAQNPFSARGASVWDATVSHAGGAMVKQGVPRSLVLRSINGSVGGGSTLKVNLPVGAIITGLTHAASTGEWVAETGAGDLAATTHSANEPFHCDTRERATITVRETTGAPSQHGGFLTLRGYW